MYINPDIYDFDEIINQKRQEQYRLDKEIDAYAIAKAALIKEIPQDEINFREIKEIYYSCEKNGGKPNDSTKDKLNRLMAVFGIKESQYKFYAITFEGAFASFKIDFMLNPCKDQSVVYSLILPRFSETQPSDATSSLYDYAQYVFGVDNGLHQRDDFYEYNTIMKSYDIDEIKDAVTKEINGSEVK